MLDLRKLEKVAQDAPQGEWHYTHSLGFTLPSGEYSEPMLMFFEDLGHDFTPDPDQNNEMCLSCGGSHLEEIDPLTPAFGAYLETFNAAVLLELIAELRATREQVRQVRLLAMSTDHLQLRRKINDALGDLNA